MTPDLKKFYGVFRIGCIECGNESHLVASCESLEKANKIATEMNKKHYWFGGGQNEYEVFESQPVGWIHEDFK